MHLLFYNLFLLLYRFAIRIAALFNPKAKQWVLGRKDILQQVKGTLPHNEDRVWFHCASVGEFEQARPVIEGFRKLYPAYKVVLTFFSPSGYEFRRNYEHADYVFYLPMDGRKRSAAFVRAIAPRLAVFVKYEFWYYYLCNLELRGTPVLLISASFRRSQPFFKWYGGLFRKMLGKFSGIFVQDEHSKTLLLGAGVGDDKVWVAGDTRYDRVLEIAAAAKEFPLIEQWRGQSRLLIAGSTWGEDEKLLRAALSSLPAGWKLVVAPHELHERRMAEVMATFGTATTLYSTLADKSSDARVLIIDNMGMLSSLYRYGEIAYVGGGFQKGGIHNTLEPAVFGLPVIFGPVYEKFVDAVRLKEQGFGFPVDNLNELKDALLQFIMDDTLLRSKQRALKQYIAGQAGATRMILEAIQQRFIR